MRAVFSNDIYNSFLLPQKQAALEAKRRAAEARSDFMVIIDINHCACVSIHINIFLAFHMVRCSPIWTRN